MKVGRACLPFLLVVLCSETATAKDKIAILPLAAMRVDQEIVDILNEVLTVEVSNLGTYEVISAGEINALLGMEKMKSSLGCDDVSCASEIGGALGARYMLTGSVGKLGDSLNINLTLFDTREITVLKRARQKTLADERYYEAGILGAISDVFGIEVKQTAATAIAAPQAVMVNPGIGIAAGPPETGWSSGAATTGWVLAVLTVLGAFGSDMPYLAGDEDRSLSPVFGGATTALIGFGVPVVYAGGASASGPGVVGAPELRTLGWVTYAGSLVACGGTAVYRVLGGESPIFALAAGVVGGASFSFFARDASAAHDQAEAATSAAAATGAGGRSLTIVPSVLPTRVGTTEVVSTYGFSVVF